jgi:NAD(P)-dependent dehydrogenase (short-subunit alcohol dehydrogenase family)
MNREKMKRENLVLITGGGRGIGAAVAQSFAREGSNLALVARTAGEIETVAASCRSCGVQALALVADVSRPEEIAAAVRAAEKSLGPIDVLVSAAGVYGPIGPLVENDLDAWANALSVNLMGTVYALHAVLPGMIERRQGVVISFSGGGAVAPFPRFSAYAASKAAVVRLTETVAEEVREYGIRVNAIAPGAVNTRLLDEVLAAGDRAGRDFHRKALEQKANGGTPPERAAELALFLASPEARGITGRLLSAVWDDWKTLGARSGDLEKSALYTLRRIDGRNFTEIRAVAAR